MKNLESLLFGLQKPQKKTQLVALYPNGHKFVITKKNGSWWYKQGAGAYPLKYAIEGVIQEGGTVVREAI
jgi:hypothetical protein